jgi:hypothetical protein
VLKNNTQLRSTDMRVEREEWSLEDNPSKESQTFNVDVAKAFELQHTDPAPPATNSTASGAARPIGLPLASRRHTQASCSPSIALHLKFSP